MACSHASTAPRRGTPGPTAPVPQGQFQDQRRTPLSTAPQVQPASPLSRGPRVCPPVTSGPSRHPAGEPSISTDQRGQQPPGPAVDSVLRRCLGCPGVRPTLPWCPGSARRAQSIQGSSHLSARAKSGASRPSAARAVGSSRQSAPDRPPHRSLPGAVSGFGNQCSRSTSAPVKSRVQHTRDGPGLGLVYPDNRRPHGSR
ncbi:hypothetical protein NDU88_005642 [Pleurodeles waltl]|uniref:Uncharacterized protein n=1 Tax=Pleurodeles waltl TaxID=8319 RepID=A0AAV7PJ43_PLEWA|nr:hypothetical protein NDU88_005642 [Pleurodeles waltl]